MKITLSKCLLAIVIAVALFLSALNTYFILGLRRDYAGNASTFNYVVFQDGNTYRAKSQTSGLVDLSSTNASMVISQAVAEGDSVYVKSGVYPLTADIEILNKKNARLVGDDVTILGNGYGIIIKGDNYTASQYNLISGLKIVNGSVRIENSFATTISDMTFEECQTALEFANTNAWTEGTKVDNIHFINCTESITFRTPSGNGTGSYASTEITRCFFNQLDNSVGIRVEQNAEVSDSQLSNSRMWLGENGKTNQTGLLVDGAMFQTLLSGVVFESFADSPENMYAIAIGENANPAPTLDSVSFLGNWTARVHNPNNVWIPGTGSLLQRSEEIPIGTNNLYGETVNVHVRPATISSFRLKIQVQGTLAEGETVTVKVRLEFVDNVISQSVERSFTNTTAVWLSDDEMLRLFPSQDVVWAILIDAKTSSSSTRASVNVDMYGITT
jgi:hypothetical protein